MTQPIPGPAGPVPTGPVPAGPVPAGPVPAVPWARQGGSNRKPPVTERVRRLVQGLPDWDPLPPGEILVVRPGRD